MKKFRTLLCLALSFVMLFALTACGDNTFNGNFKKEATTEEIKTVMADVEKAIGNGECFDETKTGLKITLNQEVSTTVGTKTVTIKSEAEEQTQVVDNKLELSCKGTFTVNGNECKIEEYINADGVYINLDGKKGMISTKSEFGKEMAEIMDEYTAQLANLESVLSQLNIVLKTDAEKFAETGIKVYIDNSGKTTKIKYEVTEDALKNVMGGTGVSFTFNKYDLYIVLNADKKIEGVKVDVDFGYTYGTYGSMTMKMDSSVVMSDKSVKFPSFKDYTELKEEKDFEEFFKDLTDKFKDLM